MRFKSYDDLVKYVERSKVTTMSVKTIPRLCETACQLYDQGTKKLDSDEEGAYVYLMRAVTLTADIMGHAEYKKNKKILEKNVCLAKDCMILALDKLEELKSSLKLKYLRNSISESSIESKEDIDRNTTSSSTNQSRSGSEIVNDLGLPSPPTHSAFDDKAPSDSKMQPESGDASEEELDPSSKNSDVENSQESTEPAELPKPGDIIHVDAKELYTNINSASACMKTLIFDLRPASSFHLSHIAPALFKAQLINVDPQNLRQGLDSETLMEQCILSKEHRILFQNRLTYKSVFIMTENDEDGDKVKCLQDALITYEGIKPIHVPLNVVNGGYMLFNVTYPHLCNSKYRPARKTQASISSSNIPQDYPVFKLSSSIEEMSVIDDIEFDEESDIENIEQPSEMSLNTPHSDSISSSVSSDMDTPLLDVSSSYPSNGDSSLSNEYPTPPLQPVNDSTQIPSTLPLSSTIIDTSNMNTNSSLNLIDAQPFYPSTSRDQPQIQVPLIPRHVPKPQPPQPTPVSIKPPPFEEIGGYIRVDPDALNCHSMLESASSKNNNNEGEILASIENPTVAQPLEEVSMPSTQQPQRPPSQPSQRPPSQPPVQQPSQRPPSQPPVQQPSQRPVQQQSQRPPSQPPVQQPSQRPPSQRPPSQPTVQQQSQPPVQQPSQRPPSQRPPSQPTVQQQPQRPPSQPPVQQPSQRPPSQPPVQQQPQRPPSQPPVQKQPQRPSQTRPHPSRKPSHPQKPTTRSTPSRPLHQKPHRPTIDRTRKPSKAQIGRCTPELRIARNHSFQAVQSVSLPAHTGLKNLGNTCFMNSILQCMAATVPFSKFFSEDRYRLDLNRRNPLGCKGELAEEFAELMRVLTRNQYRHVNPSFFKSIMSKFAPQFAGNQQQDSQEFASFLLDGLHEDINRIKDKPIVKSINLDKMSDQKAADISWRQHCQRNDSLVVDFFQGQFKSSTRCNQCHYESTSFSPFMFLSVPVPSSTRCTLKDCLRAFSKTEKMSVSDGWKCPRCKCARAATRSMGIWKLPPILIIHLKRFYFQGPFREKLQTKIDFPVENLKLREHVMNPRDDYSNVPYNLYGVSNHYGNLSGGHYTAYCKDSREKRWYHYDDSEVRAKSSRDVTTNAAYVLFYTAVDFTSLASSF